MELNEKYQNLDSNFDKLKDEEINISKLRNIHITIEAIYENLKNKRSAIFYKTAFYILFGISVITYIVDIVKFGFGFGVIFLLLLVLYFFYYNYQVKNSLKKNIKTKVPDKIEPEKADFLKVRIQYIKEGLMVAIDRNRELRNFYMIFFSLTLFAIIHIIKSPMSVSNNIWSFVICAVLGAGVWFYYFGLDRDEINTDKATLDQQNDEIQNI